jgi:hypothetical protein
MSASSDTSLHQDEKASHAGAVTSNPSPSESLRDHYDIPHLEDDGSNYLCWKSIIQMVLELHDLWPVVDGTAAEPDKATSPDAHATWYRKDVEARVRIMLTLKKGPRGPLNSVLGVTRAKECWDKLSAWFRCKANSHNAFRLFVAVFQNTFSDTEPLEPQIDSLVRDAYALINFGVLLDDKLAPFAILYSLPPSLSDLRETILRTEPSSGFTIENVTSQILLDEHRRIRKSGRGAREHFARATTKGKAKSKSRRERAENTELTTTSVATT